MVHKATTKCIDASVAFLSLLLLIFLCFSTVKSLQHERNSKKSLSIKIMKLCVLLYFISEIIAFAMEIIDDITSYLKITTSSNDSKLELISTISWLLRDIAIVSHYGSWGYFMKLKLEYTYKNTFLSVNKPFINISFIIYFLSQLFHSILTAIRYDISYWWPSFANKHYIKLHKIAVFQSVVTECIYGGILLILFNYKLCKFTSFTMENDQILSSQINNTLRIAITKQTNLLCIMITAHVGYSVIDYLYYNTLLLSRSNWYFLYLLTHIVATVAIPICLYLTFTFNKKYYDKICKYSNLLCLYLSKSFVLVKQNDNYDSYVLLNTNVDDSKYEFKYETADICIDKESCVHIDKIIEILCTNSCNLMPYKLKDVLDNFSHLLQHHDDKYCFNLICDRLTKQTKNVCDIKKCGHYLRNNRRRLTNIKLPNRYDNNDPLLMDLLDKIHSFYYHSHIQSLPTEKQNISNKFTSNIDTNDIIMGSDGNIYSFGQQFEYEINENKNNSHWNVLPKYNDLKDELLNNEISNISMDIYELEINKSNVFIKTKYVKWIQNRRLHQIIKVSNILSLLIYCNCDIYQYKWSSTFRRIPSNESDQSLKQRHSYFYWSSLYLLYLVEQFGEKCIDNEHKKFYHGVSKILYFDKTITQFYGPLSTSEDVTVANNFSGRNGLLLELKYKFSSYPLLSKYFKCSFFSNYPNEMECLFMGGIPMLIITNIINISNNNENYQKYIIAINHLNSIMNGTYKYHCKHNTDLLVELLSFQINNNNDRKCSCPNYIISLMHKYCMNLKNIVISWNNVFDANGDKHLTLKQLFTDNENDIDTFFDLDVLKELFPNIEQIEYQINKSAKHKIIQDIVHYVANKNVNIKSLSQLKYIIIHHISKQGRVQSIKSKVQTINMMNTWYKYNTKNKIILYKEEKFDIDSIKFHFNQIKQGHASKHMLTNLL